MFHTTHNLPLLSADEQYHSEQLHALIRDELSRHDNWMGFDRYMELALYAPGLGYYNAGAYKLGAGGDFITAPEISPLFSYCIANQCAEVLQSLNGGSLLELGAGTGVMAADGLKRLETLQSLPDHYYILEVSAELQQRQRALLQTRVPHLINRVQWLSSLPGEFKGVIVANEVVDALPVKRFVVADGLVCELGVSVINDKLTWKANPANDQLRKYIDHIVKAHQTDFSEGYVSEANMLLPAWVQSLSNCLAAGVMLFVDYGLPRSQYYEASRTRGTLNCFFKHHQHENPFVNLGVQDITAWVDFTALAEAGSNAGLQLSGFSTQAHFLIGAGIESLLHDAMNRDDLTDTQRWQLSQQVQQLMLPSGMGETFKAMALSKHCDIELSGISFRDLRESL